MVLTKDRVFVSRPIWPTAAERLREAAEVEVWPGPLPPPTEVLWEKLRGCAGVLCLVTERIDEAALQAAGPQLRVVSQMAVGVDNIDVAAATRRGVPVGHTPGVLTEATADFAWALLMAAARRVVAGDRFARSGQWTTWDPALLVGAEVAGATLGIIGFGRIGQAVARRAQGFAMRVLYTDHRPRPEAGRALGAELLPLPALLAQADFVTVHVPLTAETHHLLGAEQFALMKPTAILINTARGPIVDAEALYHVLAAKRLAGAALDVTDPEPIRPDSPLLALENVIVTPHIASAGQHTRQQMATIAVDNVLAGLRGQQLPHCVNPQVYAPPQDRLA